VEQFIDGIDGMDERDEMDDRDRKRLTSSMPSITPKRIVVIRGGGVGDFILTLPVLGALRRTWPEAHLELIAHPSIAELARGRYYAHTVRAIEDAAWARMFTGEPLSSASGLHAYWSRVDLAVNFLADREGLFQKSLSGLGLRYLQVGPPAGPVHAAEHFLRALAQIGVSAADPQPRLYPNEADRAAAAAIFGGLFPPPPKPVVTIHPGSGSPGKNWPAGNYAETVRRLSESEAFHLLLLSGEADLEAAEAIKHKLGHQRAAWLEEPSLTHLAALFEKVVLHLGNDSGISHLAAAAGAPVLALFGPTTPQIWRPLGERVRVLPFQEATVERVCELIRAHSPENAARFARKLQP
jgi:heptosyltransferase III